VVAEVPNAHNRGVIQLIDEQYPGTKWKPCNHLQGNAGIAVLNGSQPRRTDSGRQGSPTAITGCVYTAGMESVTAEEKGGADENS